MRFLQCDFEQISYDYIDSLIDFETKSVWPYPDIYNSRFNRFIKRIAKFLIIIISIN